MTNGLFVLGFHFCKPDIIFCNGHTIYYYCIQLLNPKKDFMSIINVVIILIVVGLLLYLVNRFIPMDYKIKQILNIVVVIAVIIWLLKAFGLLSGIGI